MRALLQHTLDLFDSLSADEPAPLPAPENLRPKRAPGHDPSAHSAIGNGAKAGPTERNRLPGTPKPAFSHPDASREIRLGGVRVAYAFARGKRRTIGFSVGPEGLSVRAPRWVALRDVDVALQEKADWIVRKLIESRDRLDRLSAARIVWRDGALFPVLGESVVLRLGAMRAGSAGRVRQTEGGAHGLAARGAGVLKNSPRELRIDVAPDAGEARIRHAAQAWMMAQARRVFTERLDHFAPRLGVQWRKLSLSNAATRWGSATADGSIRLNWRLIHFAPKVVDYVVVHELAHLRVMNHSPRFWALVASVVPDHAQMRRQLKDDAVNWGQITAPDNLPA